MKFISIVSGCFNEEENIGEFVRRVSEAMAALPAYDYEIIVIDNASTDGTARLLRQLCGGE